MKTPPNDNLFPYITPSTWSKDIQDKSYLERSLYSYWIIHDGEDIETDTRTIANKVVELCREACPISRANDKLFVDMLIDEISYELTWGEYERAKKKHSFLASIGRFLGLVDESDNLTDKGQRAEEYYNRRK